MKFKANYAKKTSKTKQNKKPSVILCEKQVKFVTRSSSYYSKFQNVKLSDSHFRSFIFNCYSLILDHRGIEMHVF